MLGEQDVSEQLSPAYCLDQLNYVEMTIEFIHCLCKKCLFLENSDTLASWAHQTLKLKHDVIAHGENEGSYWFQISENLLLVFIKSLNGICGWFHEWYLRFLIRLNIEICVTFLQIEAFNGTSWLNLNGFARIIKRWIHLVLSRFKYVRTYKE